MAAASGVGERRAATEGRRATCPRGASPRHGFSGGSGTRELEIEGRLRTFVYQGTELPWSKSVGGKAAALGSGEVEAGLLGVSESRDGASWGTHEPGTAALVPESQSASSGLSLSVGSICPVRPHCFQGCPAYRRSAQGSGRLPRPKQALHPHPPRRGLWNSHSATVHRSRHQETHSTSYNLFP